MTTGARHIKGMSAPKLLHLSAFALLAGYLILSWIGIESGLSSIDSYGVIATVNTRLQTGEFVMSRPPGHPLSEDWLVPGFARIVEKGPIVSSETYGYYQLAGGLCCGGMFWLLLGQGPILPARRLLATACLVFSPFFLIESSDGEEFLWATSFFFAALFIVSKLSICAIRRPLVGWGLAVTCAVAASGCRVEFGALALGMVFWTLLASNQSFKAKLGFIFLAAWLTALLWGPLVIRFGMNQPYAIPLGAAVRFGVGLYKIVFRALGVIPMALALVFFFKGRCHFRILPPMGKPLVGYWSVWLVLGFFALFFIYPMKPAVVIPMVAFLIVLGAMHAGPWLWACFVAACMSVQLVQIDCFDNRVWAGLKIKQSLWEQSLQSKPAFKGPEIGAASRLALGGRRLVIANATPWDLEWQLKRGSWFGVPMAEGKTQDWAMAYRCGPGVVMSRMMMNEPSFLQDYAHWGYEVWLDRDVYREDYMRYRLSNPVPATVVIDGVTCRIVGILDAK